jgi:predicted ATPase
LVSSAVAALVGRRRLPGGLVLTDLGEHRLRDLGQPTRLFHLDGPGLPGAHELPRLRTLDTRSSLPVQVSSFVGRAAELAAVTELLDHARLVTLTGPGGCGKTRLGLQVAAERLDRHPDGIAFADLAPVGDAEGVVGALAGALGVHGEGGGLGEATVRHDLDRIADRVGGGAMLLVLDTCEHVVDAAADVAEELLRRCPRAVVLATSREALQVPGEHVWPVPPLAVPAETQDATGSEAVELFCERARAADPTFVLDDATAAAVVEICRRLDGMPLALELAAVRLRSLSAVEVAERLDHRLSLLGAGTRRGIDRQQTMQATLDWSHDLLGDDERALLVASRSSRAASRSPPPSR